jgi:hypothetical protein
MVYNKNKSFMFTGDASLEVLKAVGYRAKSFWEAHVDGDDFVLDYPAPWQKW